MGRDRIVPSRFRSSSISPSSGVRRPAPAEPGMHNSEVLSEVLGFGDAELAELAEAGAI